MLKKDLVKIFQKGRDLITSGGYIQQTDDAISDEEMLVLEKHLSEFVVVCVTYSYFLECFI